jgi:hypothetical protein
LCKQAFKVDLHYGSYHSQLVHFEAQKNISYVNKGPSLEQFMPQCKQHFKWCLHKRENIKHCRYRQQWQFENMGKFLLKLHRSAKSLDSHRVCQRTFNDGLKEFHNVGYRRQMFPVLDQKICCLGPVRKINFKLT